MLTELFVATMLPQTGETGVQTHLNVAAQFAQDQGLNTHIVTPYEAPRWLRAALRAIPRAVARFDAERGKVLARLALAQALGYRLRRAMRSADYKKAVIYAQDPLSAHTALKLAGSRIEVRVVLVVHFNISEAWEAEVRGIARPGGPLLAHFRDLEREVIPRVHQLIFVSRFMEQHVLERIPAATAVPRVVIPNFIPPPLNGPATFCGDLINIGTLEPRKNQECLIRLVAEAARRGHRYRFTLVGEGPLRHHLSHLAAQLGVADLICFAGYQKNAASLIHNHRVYVHGAKMENCPITLIESLATGRPVLAPPVGGISEIYSHGTEGFYLTPDQPEQSVHDLIRLLENQALYSQMSEAARRRYQSAFSPTAVGPRWLQAVLGE